MRQSNIGIDKDNSFGHDSFNHYSLLLVNDRFIGLKENTILCWYQRVHTVNDIIKIWQHIESILFTGEM